MIKILLTAFDPFGGEKINPALEAVKLVNPPDDVELIKLEVPTSFSRSADAVIAAIRENRPSAVLCVGQAGGRKSVTPERVAINLADATICDNDGEMPEDEKILADGPDACFSTLPVKRIAAALTENGISSEISNTAGTFVCNFLMYSVLCFARREFPGMKAGFVHVPFIPEQAAGKSPEPPSMPLESIVRGLEVALKVIADDIE